MILVLIVVITAIAGVSYAQEIPPMPTVPPAMWQYSTSAGQAIDNLPTDPSTIGGASVVPDPNAAMLFGYIKWLSSPSITRELLGEQLSPFADMTILTLIATIIWTAIYLALRLVILLVRIMNFLFNLALKLYHAAIALADLIKPG